MVAVNFPVKVRNENLKFYTLFLGPQSYWGFLEANLFHEALELNNVTVLDLPGLIPLQPRD